MLTYDNLFRKREKITASCWARLSCDLQHVVVVIVLITTNIRPVQNLTHIYYFVQLNLKWNSRIYVRSQ